MTVILLAALALALSPCANAQTSGAEVLTLDEAISLARSNNRELKQSGLEIGKQRQALGEAKTQFYPRLDTSLLAAQLLTPLDFTINKGQLGTFPGTGPIPGSNTDLHTPARVAQPAPDIKRPAQVRFRPVSWRWYALSLALAATALSPDRHWLSYTIVDSQGSNLMLAQYPD